MTWCVYRGQRTAYRNWFCFHHVDPWDQTQVIGLGGECLYPQSHLTGLCSKFPASHWGSGELAGAHVAPWPWERGAGRGTEMNVGLS